jgi:hypothetical protein
MASTIFESESMDEQGDLVHVVYASAATVPFSDYELQELLAKARSTNAALNVSGMLLHLDGSFFQVLEGPQCAVDDLYTRIGGDDRHDRITLIIREAIASR